MFGRLGGELPVNIVLSLPALENGQKGDEKRQVKVERKLWMKRYTRLEVREVCVDGPIIHEWHCMHIYERFHTSVAKSSDQHGS